MGQDLRERRDRKISSLYCFIVEQNNPFQKGFSVRDPQVPLSSSWLWLEEQHRHLNIWIWFPLLLKGTSHSPHKKACMPKSELRIQWGDRGGLMSSHVRGSSQPLVSANPDSFRVPNPTSMLMLNLSCSKTCPSFQCLWWAGCVQAFLLLSPHFAKCILFLWWQHGSQTTAHWGRCCNKIL